MGRTRRAQGQTEESAPERAGDRGDTSPAKRGEGPPAQEVACEACGKTVPRLQATRCASCKRTFCRLCVRWYGHFMLVCEDCRAADW